MGDTPSAPRWSKWMIWVGIFCIAASMLGLLAEAARW
jgi:hypothetical protein